MKLLLARNVTHVSGVSVRKNFEDYTTVKEAFRDCVKSIHIVNERLKNNNKLRVQIGTSVMSIIGSQSVRG